MHDSCKQLIEINNEINNKVKELNYQNYNPKVIAVSKTFTMEKIKPLLDLGHTDFGENRVQELTQKAPLLPDDIRWHFIGHLQSNKVKYIVHIHSIGQDT